MKKLRYTLIELLAAMTIFIIMIGILFRTFSASADVAASETTRLSIMTDANVFYQYLTSDIKAMSIDIIAAPRNESNSSSQLHINDTSAASDFSVKELLITPSTVIPTSDVTIEFYSDVTAYNFSDFDTNSDGAPDLSPYIVYEFDSTNGIITRKHFTDDTKAAPTYSVDPIILEGVEEFDIKVWDDYPGGSQITQFPSPTKPSCITFSVTLTSPNPYASSQIKEKAKRTISKTLYLNK